MIKKSLLFVLIAVVSAGLLFVGCDNGTSSTESQPVIPGTNIVIDHTVNSASDLSRDLMDTSRPEWQVIAFDISSASAFATSTTIPAGKTVVLINSGSDKQIDVGTNGLIIEGKLIVSNRTGVVAEKLTKIFIGNAGSVDVQRGGVLVTDLQTSVSNYVANSADAVSVLTSRVKFEGGSALGIMTEEFQSVDQIRTLLGYINSGISVSRATNVDTGPSILYLDAEQNFSPSEIAVIPGISEYRSLIIKAKKGEIATILSIPAGADITATVPVTSVTSLDVAGSLVVPTGSFGEVTTIDVKGSLDATGNALPKLTALTVSGTLNAVSATTGDTTGGVIIIVEKDGEVKLGSITKINAGSKVAAGGSLTAKLPNTTTGGSLSTEIGAIINGVKITTTGGYEVYATTPPTPEAGKTYVLQDSAAISITGTPTFPAGSTLVIPEGVSASVGSSVTLTVNGTLTAAGTFAVTGGTLVNTGTVEVAGEGEFTLGNAGTLTNSGNIEVSGKFTIPSSNTETDGGTNNGTILVKAGGEIYGNNVTKIGGTGFTVVEAGAKAYFGESPFIGLDTDTTAIFQLSRGTFSYNNTFYILDGIAKLPASEGFNVGDLHLTLKPGAVLTVANELRIADTSVVDSEPSGTNPAKIVFNSGGKLTFKTDSTSNFYTNAGQLITASGSQTFSSGAQFIWTAISGSTGWKQQ